MDCFGQGRSADKRTPLRDLGRDVLGPPNAVPVPKHPRIARVVVPRRRRPRRRNGGMRRLITIPVVIGMTRRRFDRSGNPDRHVVPQWIILRCHELGNRHSFTVKHRGVGFVRLHTVNPHFGSDSRSRNITPARREKPSRLKVTNHRQEALAHLWCQLSDAFIVDSDFHDRLARGSASGCGFMESDEQHPVATGRHKSQQRVAMVFFLRHLDDRRSRYQRVRTARWVVDRQRGMGFPQLQLDLRSELLRWVAIAIPVVPVNGVKRIHTSGDYGDVSRRDNAPNHIGPLPTILSR